MVVKAVERWVFLKNYDFLQNAKKYRYRTYKLFDREINKEQFYSYKFSLLELRFSSYGVLKIIIRILTLN